MKTLKLLQTSKTKHIIEICHNNKGLCIHMHQHNMGLKIEAINTINFENFET